jgi:predicted MFS family arabinose efflux permease
MGYFGAVFGFSSVAGPLLGGFLTDNLSWRWVFYVNVPIAIAAFAVTGAVLPKGHRVGNPRIDYVGSAILVAAVSCLVLWATWGGTEYAWDSPTIVGLGLAALVLLGVLVVVERRVAEPVIPVHLFSVRSFNVVITVSFIVGAAMFGAISFLPLFLQVVTGASATNSGLLLLPLMLGLLTASTGSGQIISRTGRYKFFPLLGTALATLAMFLLASMGPDTTGGTVALYMVILGAGLGFTMQTLILAVQNAVGPGDMGPRSSARWAAPWAWLCSAPSSTPASATTSAPRRRSARAAPRRSSTPSRASRRRSGRSWRRGSPTPSRRCSSTGCPSCSSPSA